MVDIGWFARKEAMSTVGVTTMNDLVDPVDPQIAVSPREKGTLVPSWVGPDGKKQ